MRKITGALLLISILVGGALIWKYVKPRVEERQQRATSDASKTHGKIVVALDNWIGYWPLRSSEMKSQMRQAGWVLEIIDDSANYPERMKRLAGGKYQFAVATVDSFILNAARCGFPGTVIAALDESKGGDAILARADRVASIDALRNKAGIKVAFTPDSPSHHLAKAAADHFNVPEILPPPGDGRRIETRGSDEAIKKLLAGAADIAIGWEPDVSRALTHKGIVKLLGTEDTEKLIVDILIAERDFSHRNPDAAEQFLSIYFRVLKHYRDNPEQLLAEVKNETGLPEDAVRSMLNGVRWISLTENCENWFGISSPGARGQSGMLNTIEATVRILINAGDFKDNPLPDRDPGRIMYSVYLEHLYTSGISGFTAPAAGAGAVPGSLEAKFSPLDEAGWERLREIGMLKVKPIIFQQGATELDFAAKEVLDEAVSNLKHYPHFRILIKGHTATAGDPEENKMLSQDRAESVARYLQVAYGVDSNRMRIVGHGGSRPLPMLPGESKRAWEYRLPRVELVLMREDF